MKSFDFFFHFRHLAEANDVAQLRNRSTADGVAFFFSFHFFFTRRQFVLFRFLFGANVAPSQLDFLFQILFVFCFFHRNGFFFFFDGVVCCFCFFRFFFFTHFEPFWRNCGNVATLCPFSGRYRVLYRVFYRVFLTRVCQRVVF